MFNDSLGNADRPITVYTYRPAAWNQSGPIVFVMPGAGRGGYSPRETWIPYAEQYSSLLVVPEFSQEYYPGDLWYPLGYTYGSTNWEPKANWTFMAIEHLFDDIREKSGATTPTYLLDGHSAGGQFVHRLVTFLPDARVQPGGSGKHQCLRDAGLYNSLPVRPQGFAVCMRTSSRHSFHGNSSSCPAEAIRTRTIVALRISLRRKLRGVRGLRGPSSTSQLPGRKQNVSMSR